MALHRVAAIYDIHANLPALDAVLAEIRAAPVDHIVVGGDVVPGPMPRETLARLLDLDVPVSFIQGNGEAAVFQERVGIYQEPLPAHARAVVRWTGYAITGDEAAVMASWPMLLTLAIEGIGDVLFCHGTPRHHNEIFLATTSEESLRPLFDPLHVPLVVCGHSHMAFDRYVGPTRVVNAGSVGLPFGAPGADWLLLGPDVQRRHTTYDLATAAAEVRSSSYPDAEGFAKQILEPSSPESIVAAFAKAELRYGVDG